MQPRRCATSSPQLFVNHAPTAPMSGIRSVATRWVRAWGSRDVPLAVGTATPLLAFVPDLRFARLDDECAALGHATLPRRSGRCMGRACRLAVFDAVW